MGCACMPPSAALCVHLHFLAWSVRRLSIGWVGPLPVPVAPCVQHLAPVEPELIP